VIRFEVDRERGIRHALFEGTVGDDELLGAYGALIEEPDYDPTLDDLVDLRIVGRLDVSTPALRQLIAAFAPIDLQGIPTRCALVAGSTFTFGMSRMYELLRGDDTPEEIRVFDDYEEALTWLAEGRALRGMAKALGRDETPSR
jgi:hypothetical protein